MLRGRTIAAVVPAYNEAPLVGRTLAGIPPEVDHIVVIDDGSIDGTVDAVRACGRDVELIQHVVNRGVGASVATGCSRVHALRFDVAVVIAADGQMHPRDLEVLVGALVDTEADFVKGNRLAWPGARRAMPAHRWLGNWALSWATRFALGMPLTDSQCGYVALSSTALCSIEWERLWKGYGYPNDLLSLALARRLRIEEALVRPVYGEERSGIRLRHALGTIPFVIARAWVRRIGQGAI